MQKVLHSFLFIFLSCQMVWASGPTSHDTYKKLTTEQKDELVSMAMELMVKLNEAHLKAVSVEGPKSEKARHYSLLLRKLTSFIVEDAYAEYNQGLPSQKKVKLELGQYGADFINNIENTHGKGKKCFYAGWVSRTYPTKIGLGFKDVCLHPIKLPDSPERRAYLKSESCQRPSKTVNEHDADSDQISCNPAIFGFKNQADGSQFCVSSGPEISKNVSLECMRKAMALGANQEGDNRQIRLQHLREQLDQNPKLAAGLYEFIYKTCLCDSPEKSNAVINPDYIKKVKGSKTCYSMLNMLAQNATCETPVEIMDTTIFDKIKEFTISKTKDEDLDTAYTRHLNLEVINKSKIDYDRLCLGTITRKNSAKLICEAYCGKSNGTVICPEILVKVDGTDNELEIELPEDPIVEGKKFLVKIKGENKTINCMPEIYDEITDFFAISIKEDGEKDQTNNLSSPEKLEAVNSSTQTPILVVEAIPRPEKKIPEAVTTEGGQTSAQPAKSVPTTQQPIAEKKQDEKEEESLPKARCEITLEPKDKQLNASLKIHLPNRSAPQKITWINNTSTKTTATFPIEEGVTEMRVEAFVVLTQRVQKIKKINCHAVYMAVTETKVEAPQVASGPKCKIDLEVEAEGSDLHAKLTTSDLPEEMNVKKVDWEPKSRKMTNESAVYHFLKSKIIADAGKTVTATVTLADRAGNESKISCTEEYKEPQDAEKEIEDAPSKTSKPTLALEEVSTTPVTKTFRAKITGNDLKEWKLKWFKKGVPGTAAAEVGRGLDLIIESREARYDYQICAVLEKGEERIEKCGKVPRQAQVQNPNGMMQNPFGQQQQPMMRAPSNFSTPGVK